MLAGFPFLQVFFLVGVPLSKECRRGELDGHNPFPFLLDSRLFSGSCFIPHLSISSTAWTSCCPLYAISIFPLPFDLLLAAVPPKTGFTSCHQREEKGFSRFQVFCLTSVVRKCDLCQNPSGSDLSMAARVSPLSPGGAASRRCERR